MIAGLMIVFVSFSTLLAASLQSTNTRLRLLRRSVRMWIVDFSGLVVQGLAVPLMQSMLLAPLWGFAFPGLRGALALPPWLAFVVSFVFIDYAYYWNHRMLHLPFFWRWHRLHHSAEAVDVLSTARNSLFTPIFIVYLWINSLFVYALGDPAPFIIASSVGAALDLWRHSGFSLRDSSPLTRALSGWLILPQQHERHHAVLEPSNYGANLACWDRLHGTFHASPCLDREKIENGTGLEISWRELIWPRREDAK